MTKNSLKSKEGWPLYKGLCSFILCVFLGACQTLEPQFQSLNHFALKMKWKYQSAQGQRETFTSYVFVQNRDFVRVDVWIPFQGVALNVVVHKDQMLVRSPVKKTYYKGAFDSQVLAPHLEKFSVQDLVALLRGQDLASWNCTALKKNKRQCQANRMSLKWIFKKNQWNTVRLTHKDYGQLQGQILQVLDYDNSKVSQPLSLENYKKQKFFLKF